MPTLPDKMSVDIASPPDREKLVAEVFYNHAKWAEISRQSGRLTLELYPRQDGKPWSFGYDEAIKTLVCARKRLIVSDV
jgi:hypothetical protein